MPSIGHAMVGLAAGRLHARRREELASSMFLFAVIGMLPDLDAIAFVLRIPYEAPFGHRGAVHSIGMAVLMSLALGLLGKRFKFPFVRVALVSFGALVVHDLCDAATDGGLGIALFWPFSNERIFLPWTPIPVAPIGLRGLLTPWGQRVMAVELVMFSPFLAYAFWPRRRKAKPAPKPEGRDPGLTT
ncbi:MAG TPA: metal-dependent hydrolase [Myxococcales bacterium]|jgi:inner membrane protein